MAATDRIHDALSEFLSGEQPGVFAMKGPWGVGKTYFWHDFIGKVRPAKNCVAYSYVSLFGVGSVPELRRAIFARQKAVGSVNSTLAMATRKYSAAALRTIKLSAAGVENTDTWAEIIEEKTLQNFLVCIDDLERKETNLSASALLGFIASLRDERKCKVVLLYNDDEIDPESEMGKTLSGYREKVVDRELTYRPTVSRSYGLVFGKNYRFPVQKDSPSNPFHPSEKRSLEEIFETAGTANIRVIKKAKDLLDYCAPHMARKYRNLWPSFARQVVKVSCLYYVHGRSIDIEKVTDVKEWTKILMHRRDEGKEAELKKYDVVRDVGYFQMRSDALILEYLKLGYVDWPAHAKLLAAEEKDHAQSHLSAKARRVWDLIWDNFQVDQATFCRELGAFVAKHGKKLNLAELSQAADILREFGEDNSAAETWLVLRVDEFVAKAGEDALMHINYGGISKIAVQMVRERLEKRTARKSIAEVFEAMTKSGSYSPRDLQYLKETTADEFYQFMKSAKEQNFLNALKTFHERIDGSEESVKTVRHRFEQALEKLARDRNDGKINARRVRYGVGFRIKGVTPD